MASAWYDIDKRGRRLEAVFKRMNTEFWKCIDNNQIDLAFAYHDRMVKLEHTIQPYVEQMTGLNRFLKKHEKGQEHSVHT